MRPTRSTETRGGGGSRGGGPPRRACIRASRPGGPQVAREDSGIAVPARGAEAPHPGGLEVLGPEGRVSRGPGRHGHDLDRPLDPGDGGLVLAAHHGRGEDSALDGGIEVHARDPRIARGPPCPGLPKDRPCPCSPRRRARARARAAACRAAARPRGGRPPCACSSPCPSSP